MTNTGNVTLTEIIVMDDREGEVACPHTVLAPGATMTCTASGSAMTGQYANVATVSGRRPGGELVWATDTSHYRGGVRLYLPLVRR